MNKLILILMLFTLPVMAAGNRGVSGLPPDLNNILTADGNRVVYISGGKRFVVVGDNPMAEYNEGDGVQGADGSGPSFGSNFIQTLRSELWTRTNAVPDYYHRIFSNFVKGSFPYPRAAHPNWIWNTNSLLFKNGVAARGVTAIGVAQELGATSTQLHFTLLTKRVAVTAGHWFHQGAGTNESDVIETRNQPVYFMTLSNTLVTQYVARVYVWWDGGKDKAYFWFTNDVPDSITPMRIATASNYYASTAYNVKAGTNGDGATLYADQDGNVYGQAGIGMRPGILTSTPYAGDSGSSWFFIGTNNEAVFYQSVSSSYTDDTAIQRIKTITTTEGVDTNSTGQSPQFIDISNYP